MTFCEAIKALKEGEKISRKGWTEDRILLLNVDKVYILKADGGLRLRPYHEIFTLEDVLAEDWEVVE